MRIYGQLVKVSRSTQEQKQTEFKGYIYHIHAGGRFGEFAVNTHNSKTYNMKCVNKYCNALFTLETPYNEKCGVTPRGKSKFGPREDITEEQMMNVEMYGTAYHVCQRDCVSRPNGMCSRSMHIDGCKYNKNHNGSANHRNVSNKI